MRAALGDRDNVVAGHALLFLPEFVAVDSAVGASVVERFHNVEPSVRLPPASGWPTEGALAVVVVNPLCLPVLAERLGMSYRPFCPRAKTGLHPRTICGFPNIPGAYRSLLLLGLSGLVKRPELLPGFGGAVVVGEQNDGRLGHAERESHRVNGGSRRTRSAGYPCGPPSPTNGVRTIASR